MDVDLLSPEDIEFLNGGNFDWEPLVENSKKGLVIRKYTLPKGYAPKETDLMLLIPPDYPTIPIDMFYFSPDVHRTDGGGINALAPEVHFGIGWQRWSRHYPPNKWRPGIDNVATHVTYVGNILKSELRDM